MNPTSALTTSDWLTILGFVAGIMGTVAVFSWGASQYLSKQFSATRNLIDQKIEKLEVNLVNKLEYHEKHDDRRFDSMHNDIWEIRVRNAARDGSTLPLKGHS